MVMESLSMKKLKEVLRLKFESNLTNRQISGALGISAGTVSHYVAAFKRASLNWQACQELGDDELILALLPHCKQRHRKPIGARNIEPDYTKIHQILRKKGINLQLLWEEYKSEQGEKSYSYSQYCRRYRDYRKTIKASMRQVHKAGEKCFIDYCGPRMPIYGPDNRIAAKAYVFVAALGGSHYTFACATLTRSLPDWISAHVDMLEFFGGVPELLIPDNEKSSTSDACYYDPDVNPTYADFARHYDVAVMPTRPRHPKDKSIAEKAVQFVETWIMAKLRHRRFYTIDELNQAIHVALIDLNNKPFKQLPGTRLSEFHAIDKPQLKALPKHRYELARFHKVKVGSDYHVKSNQHHYSVPHALIHKVVECRVTNKHVEVFYNGQCVARHRGNDTPGGSTTEQAHMPKAHQAHSAWTPSQFIAWSKSIGPYMKAFSEYLVEKSKHPECCYRQHNGFRRLQALYDEHQLESACAYAWRHGAKRFRYIKSILKTGLATDTTHSDASHTKALTLPQDHENIRGPHAFTQNDTTQ